MPSAASSTCTAAKLAGAVCAADAECGGAYVCDETRHCSLGVALGAACQAGQRCAGNGGFCVAPDGKSGTCIAPAADGAACKDATDCAGGACQAGVCAERPACP